MNNGTKELSIQDLENINGGGFVAGAALGLAGVVIGGNVGLVTGGITYVQTRDSDKAVKAWAATTIACGSFGAAVGALMPTP